MADLDPAPDADAPPADASPADAAPPADTPPADPAGEPAPEVDWRADLAGDDEKLGKFLGKFADLKALATDAKSNRDKLMQRAAAKLPDNPTDEELAAYRTEHGVPDTAAGYLDQLPNGLVVGDDDKPAVDTFLAAMHAINAPRATTHAVLETYYKMVEEQDAEASNRIAEAKSASEEALRADWGPDYKRNKNVTDAFIGSLEPDVQDALNGFAPDGLPLLNSPAVIRWLAGLALEANPLATVVPGAGSNQAQAVADEIDSIEKLMRENPDAYYRDEKKQERLRELYDARSKISDKV